MAVHTQLTPADVTAIARHYHSKLLLGAPIEAGHNNSNYHAILTTSGGMAAPIVLTVHEPPEVAPSGRNLKDSKALIDYLSFLSGHSARDGKGLAFPQLLQKSGKHCLRDFGGVKKCVTLTHYI